MLESLFPSMMNIVQLHVEVHNPIILCTVETWLYMCAWIYLTRTLPFLNTKCIREIELGNVEVF